MGLQRLRWVLVGCGVVGVLRGQVPGPPPPVLGGLVQGQQAVVVAVAAGTVTGRVVAGDTQRSVRFAQVMLQPVAAAQSAAGSVEGDRFGGVAGGRGGGNVSTRTDVEGNFVVSEVAAGDYYVSAMAPGFLPLRAWLQEKVAAGADPGALLAAIPVVHVAADGTSSVTVTLERGGTVAGRVVWEDGSWAAGVSLIALSSAAFTANGSPVSTALPAVLQGVQSAGGNSSFATTDDRGAFRITGLTSGDYLLRATIQSPIQTGGSGRTFQYSSPVLVYAPGVFRWSEAKAVSVREGDERSDVRMVIDLRGVHRVSGHVGSATAGVSVASGQVTLSDAGEKTLRLSGSIGGNGDFAVPYVPPGNYTMTVTGSSRDMGRETGGRRVRDSEDGGVAFQALTMPLVVGDADVSGVAVSLTPVQGQP